VLLLTDFGCGPTAPGESTTPLSEWLEFLDARREPLLAFVPGTVDAYPHPLRERVRLVRWDRVTTASSVVHNLRGRP
jgi:hypothetical protein